MHRVLRSGSVLVLITSVMLLASFITPSSTDAASLATCGIAPIFSRLYQVSVTSVVPSATQTTGQNVTISVQLKSLPVFPIIFGTMRWAVTGPNSATASPSSGSLKPDFLHGTASFTYTNTRAGQDSVVVWYDLSGDSVLDCGEPSASTTITWIPGVPTKIAVAPDGVNVGVGTNQTETATVQDQYGNPVADGTTVSWVIEGTNAGTASPASGTSQTTAGSAAFSYTNTTVGTDTVRAYIDGDNSGTYSNGELTGTASVNWIPGPPSTISLNPLDDTNVVGVNHSVTATVKDQYGNLVPNGTSISWVVEGANSGAANPALGTTSTTNGATTFTYTNTKSGQDTIRAYFDANTSNSFDNGDPTATTTQTWTAGPATSIVVTPATPTQIGRERTRPRPPPSLTSTATTWPMAPPSSGRWKGPTPGQPPLRPAVVRRPMDR